MIISVPSSCVKHVSTPFSAVTQAHWATHHGDAAWFVRGDVVKILHVAVADYSMGCPATQAPSEVSPREHDRPLVHTATYRVDLS